MKVVMAQQPDTLVIYEYIHVIDTVWVEPLPTRDTSIQNLLQNKMNQEIIYDRRQNSPTLVPTNPEAKIILPFTVFTER